MLEWGLILLIGGVLAAILGFIFAAGNMFSTVATDRTAAGVIGGHLGAMVIIAMASVSSIIGLILVAIHYLEGFLAAAGG